MASYIRLPLRKCKRMSSNKRVIIKTEWEREKAQIPSPCMESAIDSYGSFELFSLAYNDLTLLCS